MQGGVSSIRRGPNTGQNTQWSTRTNFRSLYNSLFTSKTPALSCGAFVQRISVPGAVSKGDMGGEKKESGAPGWRSPGSPLSVEESYLGSISVLDPRQALHLPCTVTGLTVQGNERMRREMIEREMRAALNARTHAELAAGVSSRSPERTQFQALGASLRTPTISLRLAAACCLLLRFLWPRLRKCPRQRAALSTFPLISAGGFLCLYRAADRQKPSLRPRRVPRGHVPR